MKVSIESVLFDTEKARLHISLAFWDGNNSQTGDLYVSSKGTVYALTPSQWSNLRSWVALTAAEAMNRWWDFMDEEDRETFAQITGLEAQ